jgi:cytochrome oxidase assembly protein ShyY1
MKISKDSILKAIGGLLIAVIFFELGIWQLHRAQDSKKIGQVKVSKAVAKLDDLEVAGSNMTPRAANRMVLVSGNYVQSYIARNQIVSYGGGAKKLTLEVRLLKVPGGRGILVVRGVSGISNQTIPDKVKVIGRLYPRQTSDVSEPISGELSRIDPGLVAGVGNLNLYDGYVIAQIETNLFGQKISAERIPAALQISKVAGFYWQHLVYVFIWWLLALLALSAPFYNRLRDKVGA